MGQKVVVPNACIRCTPCTRHPHCTAYKPQTPADTTPRMTTRITTPRNEDSYPTTTLPFDNADDQSRSRRAPKMFSPTNHATMGQFDTEATDPR
jgi:hypothetical protein